MEFFKITAPTGEVTYERIGETKPSEKVREIRETRGPGFTVGMVPAHAVPVETREAFGMETEIKVGETVKTVHIGIMKVGEVVKVGRTRVHVEVMIGRGTTRRPKVITRAKTEVFPC